MKTMAEIARELGVSKTTVSLVLNGKAVAKRISPQTVEMIRNFCREKGFLPNIHASLTSKKIVRNIMVLANMRNISGDENFLSDNNMARLLGGVAEEVQKSGYTFMVRSYSSNLDPEIIFNSFRTRETDGMIYYGMAMPEVWREVFSREKRHVVGVSVCPAPGIATVNLDNCGISAQLGEYLANRGVKRVFYITGNPGSFPSAERLRGFRKGFTAHGGEFSDSDIACGDYSRATGAKLMRDYLDSGRPLPDAFVCVNDTTAIAVMEVLEEKHIAIPDRIRVAGGDNIEVSQYIRPRLTTFDYRAAEMGRSAFRLLYQMINGGSPENIVLPSILIKGGSA